MGVLGAGVTCGSKPAAGGAAQKRYSGPFELRRVYSTQEPSSTAMISTPSDAGVGGASRRRDRRHRFKEPGAVPRGDDDTDGRSGLRLSVGRERWLQRGQGSLLVHHCISSFLCYRLAMSGRILGAVGECTVADLEGEEGETASSIHGRRWYGKARLSCLRSQYAR